MSQSYKLYCEPCGYKKITDGTGIVSYKRSSVQTAIPTLDPNGKKMSVKADIKSNQMVRCPNCGRGVVLKQIIEEKKNEQGFSA